MGKRVSVIIPVKNGSNYLREAIESLNRQDVPMEIIVVDDGSNDDTAAIASSYGCVVISHPVCKGQVAAKNTGLAAAKGEYVVFMDHDDVMRKGALKTMCSTIEADPEISAVQAMVKDFISPEIGQMPGTIVRPERFSSGGRFSTSSGLSQSTERQVRLSNGRQKWTPMALS